MGELSVMPAFVVAQMSRSGPSVNVVGSKTKLKLAARQLLAPEAGKTDQPLTFTLLALGHELAPEPEVLV
jgi:hypothetical protein